MQLTPLVLDEQAQKLNQRPTKITKPLVPSRHVSSHVPFFVIKRFFGIQCPNPQRVNNEKLIPGQVDELIPK